MDGGGSFSVLQEIIAVAMSGGSKEMGRERSERGGDL